MDDELNDSGYGSPKNRPAEKNEMHFITNKNSKRDRLSADIYDTVAQATKKSPEIAVNNHLFWANIRGYPDPKSISPFTLQCGLIEEGTEVKCEKYAGLIYDTCRMGTDTKSLETKLFFISMEDRRKKVGITHVNYKNFGHNMHMCVIARSSETYRNALLRDGRFKSVDQFCLKQKVDGGEADVDLDGVAEEGIVLLVAVKKNSKKNSSHGPSESASTSEEKKKTFKKVDYDKLGKKLWGKGVVYDFDKDVGELETKELVEAMGNCLRALTWYTLFGPIERSKKNFENSLEAIANIQFANHSIIARPASFTKKLSVRLDSIGFLECGDIYASCFLVSPDMIVTSCHVVRMIEDARRSSTQTDHSNVFVYFKYDYNRDLKPLSNGYKLLPLDSSSNIMSEALDYAFLLLDSRNETAESLGKYVTCKVPETGNVSIAGHPFGNIKQDELCPILPAHKDGRYQEFRSRVRKEEERCMSNPSSCQLSSTIRNVKCVHMYRKDIEKLYQAKGAMAYDVNSFFEGSSGSPVFNMNCEIVALHTAGFRLRETSLVEYGITFEAIIDDLKENGHEEFVRKHFTACDDVEPMQVR